MVNKNQIFDQIDNQNIIISSNDNYDLNTQACDKPQIYKKERKNINTHDITKY